MRITLAKAAQVPLTGPIRDRGYTADVDQHTYDALKVRGLLVDESEVEVAEVEPEAEVEKAVEPEVKKSSHKRPARTARVSEWRDYADTLGIKTSNMTRNEIIGAVNKVERG